jgi:hypothetical protein
MLATTCGETPKVDVYSRDVVKEFFKKETSRFYNFKNKSVIYGNKTLIDTAGLNYLNLIPESKVELALKNMILVNYNECENLYPYLGDLFLEYFFSKSVTQKGKVSKFEKINQKKLLESIKDVNVKNLTEWIFENISLERTINVQTHSGKDICLEVENDFSFNFSYDYDFFNSMSNVTFRNYKFVIVDGYIESVGEMHHLFVKASQDKIPRVIFCYGMSEEVKHNIMINNKKGSFKVLPVSLNANDENTLNILNDIAVIHDSDVVTSNMGQTISQEVRKNLSSGKKITFLKDRIYIDPVANSEAITVHKSFLLKRLSDAITKPDVNTNPIKNRIKNFSMKKLNIYLPDDLSKNNIFQRELSYCISFLRNIGKQYKILTYGQREYYIPKELSKIVKNKVDSLNQTIKDIEIVIT